MIKEDEVDHEGATEGSTKETQTDNQNLLLVKTNGTSRILRENAESRFNSPNGKMRNHLLLSIYNQVQYTLVV